MKSKNYSETPIYRVLVEHSPRQSDDLYLTLCGVEQCRPDKEYESRVRDGYHLHVILSGNGVLEMNGNLEHLHEGQMFLIKPGEKITYYPDAKTPWTYCWMSFGGAMAGGMMREAGFEDGVYILNSHIEVAKFYRICSLALDTPQLTMAGAIKRLGLTIQYIALAIESQERRDRDNNQKRHQALYKKQDYVRYAIDFIKNNYSNITLKDISEYLGLNYNYFSEIFKQSQGVTPNEYMLQVRMRQASQMLANLTMDIQDIANSVGYSDSLTFSKAFKRFFGMSPKHYREMSPEKRPIIDTIITNRRNRQE